MIRYVCMILIPLLILTCSTNSISDVDDTVIFDDVLSLETSFGADFTDEDYLLFRPHGLFVTNDGDIIVFDENKMMRLPGIDNFATGFTKFWVGFAGYVVRRKVQALGVVCAVTIGASVFAWSAMPKLDYLPTGNRNFVIGFVQPPAGYNLDTVYDILTRVQDKTRSLWSDTIDRGEKAVKKVAGDVEKKIDRFVTVALNGRAFIAAT